MMRRCMPAAAFAVLSLLVIAGDVRAEDPPAGDVTAFEKGMDRLFKFYEDDRCEKGLAELKVLMKAHEKQPYARGRRAELEDLARRLAFRATAKIPKPETLLSGKLVKWDGRTGKIKVVYTPETAKDLERSRSGFVWFPMEVSGACTVEVEGPSYPMSTKDSPRMIFGGDYNEKIDEKQTWQITFGTPPYTEGSNEVWMPAVITRFDGDSTEKVSEKEITPAKRGSRYKLRLDVRKNSITARVNNKPIGKARKDSAIWGAVGFEARGWSKATFSGEIEPSWVQSKIDAVLVKQREAFDNSYDRSRYLPDWLFESLPDDGNDNSSMERLSELVDGKNLEGLTKLFEALAKDDFDGALAATTSLREGGAPSLVLYYLEALIHSGRERPDAALSCIEKALAEDPKYVDGHLLKGSLLRRLGRTKESADAYAAAIAISPRSAYPYESAAMWMMVAGELDQARRFSRLAARNGVLSRRLDLLGSAIVKATRGPNWPQTFEYKSTNYHVMSDIDKKTCVEAAKVLEQGFTAYRVNFGWVGRDRSRKFKVFLFSGRKGFISYQKDVSYLMGSPSQRAAGLYSPLLKQLLIWNLPSRDEMTATIRHEGWHQYLDRFMPEAPTWFDEGLAVYHEDPKLVRGQLKFGQIERDYVDLIGEKGLRPLSEFIADTHRQFYEGGHRSYAQAWAFIHMLQHGTSDHRKLFKQLNKEFLSGKPPKEITGRLLPPDVCKKLDKELAAYVKTLD